MGVRDFDYSLTVNILLFQRQLNVRGYQCSQNLKYVLFQHNVKTETDNFSYWTILHNNVTINISVNHTT